MITHGQMSAAVISHLHGLPNFPENPILFSYLPLAHIYGRLIELICLCVGYVMRIVRFTPLHACLTTFSEDLSGTSRAIQRIS